MLYLRFFLRSIFQLPSHRTHQELRAALRVSVQLFVQVDQAQVDVVQLSLQALVLLVVALKFSLVAQTLWFIHNGRKHTLDGKKGTLLSSE